MSRDRTHSNTEFVCPELSDFVMYELHVGTFSAEGTFDAAIAHIAHLVELGVTAIEVMPIAQFPGTRNWGYDGVCAFAPQWSYGGPSGFARLVDACHAHGIAVVLDVVYNHLGPEGNYLAEFGPYYSDRATTDWGAALNFDGVDSAQVRRFFIDNALYWLRDYHVDALRLDAVHAIVDRSPRHFLEELRDEVEAQAQRLGRRAFLIAESNLNDTRIIRPAAERGYGIHAQWSDDFHHSLRTLLIPDRTGYLGDFGRMAQLARAFSDGFVYAGDYSAYRKRPHGDSSRQRPGQQFVVYQQNHDQIGNTSGAQRMANLVAFEATKLAAAVVLSAPNVPLLFMGEEFLARTPFAYFVSHSSSELLDAVRRGRAAEHGAFGSWAQALDPAHETTFESSKLDWTCLTRAPDSRQLLQLYKDLIRLRRKHPCLAACDKSRTVARWDDDALWLMVERGAADGGHALCLFNFSTQTCQITPPRVIATLTRAVATTDTRYGGSGANPPVTLASSQQNDPEPMFVGPSSAVIYLNS
jgi:maltooligosyltrehalose trehalohydrolase